MTISRIGSVTAASTSLTPTTGLAGDIMIAWAFRSTAATIPTVPSGWTTIGSGSGNTCAGVLAYHFCTGTGDASGTWTGATQLIITKYRGVLGIGGLGTPSNAASTSISYPVLTAIQTAGNSWIVGAAGHRTASNVSTAPTGMTNVSSVGAGPQAAFHDTNGGVSSWSAQSVTVNANSGHESVTCELLADSSTLNPYKKAASITLSNSNLTATGTGSSVEATCYGSKPRTSDSRIFKLVVTTVVTDDPTVGIANDSSSTAHSIGDSGDSNNSVGWTNGGGVFLNGVSIGTAAGFASGNTLWIAVNDSTQKIWCRVGSGNWNNSGAANPDTGTGGFSYAGINAGQIYPATTYFDGGEVVVFDGTAPSNPTSTFTAWDTSGATTHAATGVLTGPGSTIAGTAAHKAKHTATGALTGPGSTIAGTARRFRAHPSSGAITGPGSSIAGTARRFRKHTGSGVLSGPGALIVGAASRHGTATSHAASGVLVGQGAIIAGIAARFGWTVNAGPSTVWTGNSAATTSWAANSGPATTWTANPAASGSWTTVPGTTTTWTKK